MLELKPGDRIKVQGTGYAVNNTSVYTVTRVTAKYAFAKVNENYEIKFSLDSGVKFPRDKYINYYIVEINGKSLGE